MPAAHYLHPEFGLLCPTPRLRRRVRITVACAVLAFIAVAVLRASNSPPSPPSALTVAARDDNTDAADVDQTPAASLAAPSRTETARAEAGRTSCEQYNAVHRAWAYLDGKCVAGRPRESRFARPATNRPAIAAIALGHTAAVPDSVQEPATPVATLPVTGQAQPSAPATPVAKATASQQSPRSVTVPKKPRKTARKENRRREPSWPDSAWWREVRADEGARSFGTPERDFGHGGYVREGFFGLLR